jgi:hypothetical protein
MDNTTLKQVEELGSLNYTPKEIALIIGAGDEEVLAWMEDESSPFFRAYMKGFYTTDIAVRKSIFKLAAAGSSPAQSLVMKLRDQIEMKKYYE